MILWPVFAISPALISPPPPPPPSSSLLIFPLFSVEEKWSWSGRCAFACAASAERESPVSGNRWFALAAQFPLFPASRSRCGRERGVF